MGPDATPCRRPRARDDRALSAAAAPIDPTLHASLGRHPVRARLRRTPFAVQVLLALVAGIGLGLVARAMGPVSGSYVDGVLVPGTDANWLTSTLTTIGSTFVGLLRAIVVPLLVTAIIVSIANLKQVSNAARLAGQTLLWFAITSLIAVSIGIGLGLLTQPGNHSSVDAGLAETPETTGARWDFLTGLVPANFLGLQGDGHGGVSFNILQLIVVAAAIGIAALKVGDAAEPFLSVTRAGRAGGRGGRGGVI